MNLSKISFLAVVALTAALPAKSDLIHQYIFDGNVNDQVAGGIDGILHGDATAYQGVLTLDGQSDYVSFGNNFLIPFGGDFSVVLTAKFNPVPGSIQEFISQGSSSGPGFYLGPYGTEMRVGDNYGWTATPAYGGSCGGACTGVESPAFDEWHTYAVVVAGNNGSLYIDGVLRATKANYLTNGGGSPTILGSQFGGSGEFMNGYMQDLRIYNNALSAAEVGAYGDAPEPGTVFLMGSALIGGAWFTRRKRTA